MNHTDPSSQFTSFEDRVLPLRSRKDLVFEKQSYLGQICWMVKDPISLHYFRFSEQEYFLYRQIEQNTSLSKIKDNFENSYSPAKLTVGQVQQFLSMLYQSSLVTCERANHADKLFDRNKSKTRQQRFTKLFSFFIHSDSIIRSGTYVKLLLPLCALDVFVSYSTVNAICHFVCWFMDLSPVR